MIRAHRNATEGDEAGQAAVCVAGEVAECIAFGAAEGGDLAPLSPGGAARPSSRPLRKK